jgi:uncharacterized membrane protein
MVYSEHGDIWEENEMDVKPGHKTSEFWLVIGIVFICLVISLITMNGISLIGAALMSGFYSIGRSFLKKEQIEPKKDEKTIEENKNKNITFTN